MKFDIATEEWIKNQNRFFTISIWDNNIFEIVLSKQEIKYVSHLPEEKIRFRNCNACIFYNEVLYCFPDLGKAIWKYEINQKSWTCLEFDELNKKRNSCKICRIQDERVIFFSESIGAILEFNCITEKIEIRKKISLDTKNELRRVEVIGDCLYCITKELNKVYVVNFMNGMLKYIELPKEYMGISTLAKIGDKLYFTGEKQCLYEYNAGCSTWITHRLTSSMNEYMYGSSKNCNIEPYSKNDDDFAYYASIADGSSIWFIPYQKDQVIRFDILSKKIQVVYDQCIECNQNNRRKLNQMYLDVYKDLDAHKIYLYSLCNSEYLEIDTERNCCNIVKFNVRSIDSIESFKGIWEESRIIGLPQFLRTISKK